MRALGDVHDRTDTQGPGKYCVVVVSHDLYKHATGMVFVCPVFPDTGGIDHPMLVRCKVAGAAAVVLPDNVYRMPAAGLGESPVDSIDGVTVERIRSQIRGIFN